MTTLAEMKAIVISLIGETIKLDEEKAPVVPLRGASATSDDLINAIVLASDAILAKCYKGSVASVNAGDTELTFPEDLFEIEGIYDISDAKWMSRLDFYAGQSQMTQSESANSFIPYPYGTITFTNEIAEEGASVYYSAMWARPATDTDTLEFPEYANLCVALFAASIMMQAKAGSSAAIRQYGTKVDSGNPEHLPHIRVANNLLIRFDDAMTRIPSMQKGRV